MGALESLDFSSAVIGKAELLRMNRALFLDRDGTINEDVGNLYSEDKLIFIPRAIEALRILQKRFLLFIVTNQSGIGSNIFSEADFRGFTGSFDRLLKREGITVRHTYYCPHKKEDSCICRKPSPYFLKEAQRQYKIDTGNSFVIGDHPHDIEMAHKVDAKSIYLLTGHGQKHRKELVLAPDFIADNLYEAVSYIEAYC